MKVWKMKDQPATERSPWSWRADHINDNMEQRRCMCRTEEGQALIKSVWVCKREVVRWGKGTAAHYPLWYFKPASGSELNGASWVGGVVDTEAGRVMSKRDRQVFQFEFPEWTLNTGFFTILQWVFYFSFLFPIFVSVFAYLSPIFSSLLLWFALDDVVQIL